MKHFDLDPLSRERSSRPLRGFVPARDELSRAAVEDAEKLAAAHCAARDKAEERRRSRRIGSQQAQESRLGREAPVLSQQQHAKKRDDFVLLLEQERALGRRVLDLR